MTGFNILKSGCFYCRFKINQSLSIGNGDLNLHTGFDGDGGDLLDDLRWRMQINDTLMDAHLETIPSLGTFTARCLPGGDAKGFSWHPDGSLDLQVLILGTFDEIGAHLLETLDIPGSQGDPNSVNWTFFGGRLGILVHRHDCLFGSFLLNS